MTYNVAVLVPYKTDVGIRADHWEWCYRWWQRNLTPKFQICTGSNHDDPFNRSAARNNAFGQSSAEILIIADADTILSSAKAIKKGIDLVASEQAAWVIPYETYYNLSENFTEYLVKKSKDDNIKPSTRGFSYEHKVLSWSGCLILPRAAYQYVGGYDERFKGWGFEDNAFRLQLDHEWGNHQRVKGNAYHLWHPIAKEDEFTVENTAYNHRLYVREYENKYHHRDERIHG